MRTVAVLFGGRSLEHDVSVVSGLQILHALDPDFCVPMPVYIDQSNRWWIGDDLWHRERFKAGGLDWSRLTEVTLSTAFGSSTLEPVSETESVWSGFSRTMSRTVKRIVGSPVPGPIRVDCFVPVLHGTYGEDGSIQGLFDLRGCAYVGCGVLASAIGMNKRATKVMAEKAGVPVLAGLSCPRSVLDQGSAWLRDLPAQVSGPFGFPVIVKPCNLGSSAGVTVAGTADELVAGVLKVFEYDVEALIEPFVRNRLEINVAVAGLDEPVASVTEMPVTLQDSPLTFSEKYKREGRKSVGSSQGMAGALRVLDPSNVPVEMRADAQRFAVAVFKAMGGEGISRIDFLIDLDRNRLFFNEINTLPGSLAFYLWSAAPHYWTVTELLARLVVRAEHLQAVRNGLLRRPPADLSLLA